MAFTKTPAGASTNYTLVGSDLIDITTIPGSNGPVTVQALGNRDQVTIQSTDGVANGFDISMGEGDDRVFADSDLNLNGGNFIFTNSFIRGNEGDDIIFGDEAGNTTRSRTAYLQYSTINGNQGQDIIRTYGMLSSRIDGGKGFDKIEVTNVFDPLATPANTIPLDPDRYDGAWVQGMDDNDTIELKIGRTNFVNSTINGNQGDDLITNFETHDLSGDWSNSTIFGGQGKDTVELHNTATGSGYVSASLLVFGDKGTDVLRTGVGNDTVVGGIGRDVIGIAGGTNIVYGDNMDGSAAGNDTIRINTADVAANRQSQNTIFAGDGADTVLINTDGNNVVFGDSATDAAVGGADTITINGTGNNLVFADTGSDTVQITGGGSNTIYGAAGNDTLRVVNGRDVTIFGETGNDDIIAVNMTGAASMNGAEGSDEITANDTGFMTSGVFDAGVAADVVNVVIDAANVTYIQEDGDSVTADAITNLNGEFFQAGSVIDFGSGVDVITNFVGTNTLDTTLGDLGLDQTLNAGQGGLYAGQFADGTFLSAQSGFVFGRSYFLTGTFTGDFEDGTFTVGAFGTGADALVLTQGNNAPFTLNSNAVILEDFGASVAALNNSNFA